MAFEFSLYTVSSKSLLIELTKWFEDWLLLYSDNNSSNNNNIAFSLHKSIVNGVSAICKSYAMYETVLTFLNIANAYLSLLSSGNNCSFIYEYKISNVTEMDCFDLLQCSNTRIEFNKCNLW